jgi:uncharacterized protein DUF6933
MLTLRCTKKLMKRLGTQPTPKPLSLTNTLGDWYANLFNYDGLDIAMCVNAQTRYAIPVPLHDYVKDHTLYIDLIWRVHDAIRRLGLPDTTAYKIVKEYSYCLIIAPTADRSILGTMNELIWQCECMLDDACESGRIINWKEIWKEFEDELNQTPHKPLGYARSRDRMLELLQGVE